MLSLWPIKKRTFWACKRHGFGDNARVMVKNVQRFVDGDAEAIVDARYLPIVVTSWFGTPTLGLANAFCEWYAAFVAEQGRAGKPLVFVNDATLAGRPSGEVRSRLAAAPTPEFVLDSLVVVTHPAVRGAATAIRWMAGERMKMNFASDLPSALARALALLERSKLTTARPLVAARYELPVVQRRRRSSRSEARAEATRPIAD
jgi:hypothetical protein